MAMTNSLNFLYKCRLCELVFGTWRLSSEWDKVVGYYQPKDIYSYHACKDGRYGIADLIGMEVPKEK